MIRLPAVAGRFYPSEPAQLNQELDSFLTTEIHKSKIRAQACMVPHAGYKYSGHVAGAVYSRMEIPGRVILVGVVALPLAMAFAIASGARPEQGLYTAIVAAILTSLFG